MQHTAIPFAKTGRFSALMCDYLAQQSSLQPFYGRFPTLDNFEKQAKEKSQSFTSDKRAVLVESLQKQYNNLTLFPAVQKGIDLLKKDNTMTITTGHQLCLMTGPLFFIYKIITVIKAAQELNKKYSDYNFVPVYWMATEDHDFEEIQSFLFEGKKIQWNSKQAGRAVGTIALDDLQPVLDLFEQHLGHKPGAALLKEWIAVSYRKAHDLATATRTFVQFLFADYPLVILDGNDSALKKIFVPTMQRELEEQQCYETVLAQTQRLQKAYHQNFVPQVNPREINLFYLTENGRHRIKKNADQFLFEGLEASKTAETLIAELNKHPERFSPNVLLRPLYQETILPNVAYVGGGGELAYWFQLKSFFESEQTPFPILLLRNSALLMASKSAQKVARLQLSSEDLFLSRNELINKKIRQISNIDLDLSFLKKQLQSQFDHLEALVATTDASFEGAVQAQKAKQFKGIEALEKRLLSAQKRKLADHVKRMATLHESLFPNDGLQERQANFTSFFVDYGPELVADLMEILDPFALEFSLIKY